MPVPYVTTYLREGIHTLETLEREYHIHHRRHNKYKNLVLLKYDQIDSPLDNLAVQECRGLILDEDDKWAPVSRSFDKFFNYGEGNAAQIQWGSARIFEKLDGSMIQMYWYKGQWRVGTTGTPDGSGEVGSNGITFEDLFWKVFIEKGYVVPEVSYKDKGGISSYTFIFELMTPLNRVVVRHLKNDLKLLGLREHNSGAELTPDNYPRYEAVTSFSKDTLLYNPTIDPTTGAYNYFDKLGESFLTMDPLKQEGYVICDKYFHRVKVKHPGYLKLHHMIDGFGPKAMLEVIRSGETSELIANFPEHKAQFEGIKSRYDILVDHISVAYHANELHETPKEFALAVKDLPYSGILFSMRKGKVKSVMEGLKEIHIDKLREMVGV